MGTFFYVFLVLSIARAELSEHDRKIEQSKMSNYISSPSNVSRFPISFGKRGIGVNLLGFHASVGLLGGLLAENESLGGPHAEASTPFGLSASAGIGIRNENGSTIHYPYAEAQRGSIFHGVCLLISGNIEVLTFRECAARFSLLLGIDGLKNN